MIDAILRAVFGSDGFWVFIALFIIGYWLWYEFGGGKEKYLKKLEKDGKKRGGEF